MKDYPDRMTAEQARRFCKDVLDIVAQIPRGMVMTYGHIAVLAGWPSHARMVGRTLRYTPGAEHLPCHRVVNKEGRTAPGWSRQRAPLGTGRGMMVYNMTVIYLRQTMVLLSAIVSDYLNNRCANCVR